MTGRASVDAHIRWAEKNRERHRAYQKEYYRKNKAKKLATSASYRRKTSRLENSDYRVMLMNMLLQRDGNICGICKKHISSMEETSVDHIMPRCMGGDHRASNLQMSHRQCNREKPREHKRWRNQSLIG